jgi:class 3 adenylate cyclase
VAARIGALAAAGEILISASTLADAAADISVGPTRVATLKGLPEPLELACVEWK